MPRAEWTSPASTRLQSIVQHIAIDEGRPSVARRINDGIRDACELYAQNPHMGESWSELGPHLRSFTHKRWVIVYRPTDSGIEVIGVVDGSRDYTSYFRGR